MGADIVPAFPDHLARNVDDNGQPHPGNPAITLDIPCDDIGSDTHQRHRKNEADHQDAGMFAGGLMLWPLSLGFRSLLFGVSPLDPSTLVWSGLLLFAAGVLSALGPSRRATRVDPASALRAD